MVSARSSNLWGGITVLLAVAVGTLTASGKVISVDDDGPADFNNIQAAIDDANDGDTVIVQPGTYTGPGNRDIEFKGKAITVTSTDPNDPNIVATTVIDANGSESEPHRCFILENSDGLYATVSGLTLTGGLAEHGGAIHCLRSSLKVESCCIEWNRALEDGGAIHASDCNLVILSSTIRNNRAGFNGGGVFHYSETGLDSHVSRRNTFSNNTAFRGGGLRAMFGVVTLSQCVFLGNSSTDSSTRLGGGGGANILNGSTQVDNCLFAANSTQSTGGGFSVYSTCSGGYAEVRSCTFVHNRAISGGAAAAKGCGSCQVFLYNCILWASEPPDDPGVYHLAFGRCGWPTIAVDSSIVQQAEADQIPITDCIVADPCFGDLGYWDRNGTPDDPNDDLFIDGNYRLKSQAGRWDSISATWVIDDVTSPCIDAGDPMSPIGAEPFPNGGVVNMGAYGGTTEASKSYFGKPPCEIIVAGDVNGDCVIDFGDFCIMALHWCEDNNP